MARDLLLEDLEAILRDARFRQGLVEAPKKNTYFVLFNSRSGPTAQNPAVRRALTGLVRTRDLVWRTLGRFAEPAASLIPPGMLGHDPGRRSRALTREEAREMLAAAGLGAGLRMKAAVHPLLQDRYGSLLTTLCASWAELGTTVSIETQSMAQYLEAWQENEGFDLLIGRWNADYDDPDNFTHNLFHSGAGLLRRYFSSEESDRILEEARSGNRSAVREGLYRKYESLLFESAALIPLFHDIDYRLASPRIRGLTLRGSLPYVNYSELGRVESVQTEAEAPRGAGGILHVPIAGVVQTLDPAPAAAVEDVEVLPRIYETLTLEAGGAQIVPWLASEFRAEDGGRKYRFRLRDDVRFHDGRRLSARDVRYSFERLLQSPTSEARWLYSSIRGAQALLGGEAGELSGFSIHSAGEFSLELEKPVAFFPALLAFPAASIIPEGSDPAAGLEGCVGTGPFRVVAYEPGRRLALERNKLYWRKGYPRSEGLVFSFGVSPADILSGFRAGRFSLAGDLFPADAEALRREPEFASRYRETPRLITYFVAFNAHRGPLRDRALRQRLIRAVDVPKLVQKTLGRLAIPAAGLIPPGLLGHEPASASRAEAPSPTPAEVSPPLELTAAVHPVFFGVYAAFARELASAFGQLGIKTRPVNQTMAEYLEETTHPKVDLLVGRWNSDYPDADTFAYILHSQGGFLGRLCGSAEVDRLVERGRAETAPAARHAIYRQIEELVAREALVLSLFHEQAYRFARPEVEALSVSFGGHVAYEDLHIHA